MKNKNKKIKNLKNKMQGSKYKWMEVQASIKDTQH
jgi:hypothetical protein